MPPKKKTPYLALLRGINVGGHNIISKEDLKQCFENMGFEAVRTYIQSGNVVFVTDAAPVKSLIKTVEEQLSERFSYSAQAVVIARTKFRSMVTSAHGTWGQDETQKHNAMFTLTGITSRSVLAKLPPPKPSIENVTAAAGVLFWSASKAKLAQTTVMKLGSLPLYKKLTVRNHNTVFKLLTMLNEY